MVSHIWPNSDALRFIQIKSTVIQHPEVILWGGIPANVSNIIRGRIFPRLHSARLEVDFRGLICRSLPTEKEPHE